jgi:hypothetical protein
LPFEGAEPAEQASFEQDDWPVLPLVVKPLAQGVHWAALSEE